MYISTYKPLNRRTVLKGMGAVIALPFLESMTPMSRAASVAVQPPKRLMFHWIGTATNMADWFPKDDGPNFTLTPALTPLERVRKHLTVISGTRSFPELDYGGGPEGGHYSAPTWLTCVRDKTGPSEFHFKTSISADQLAAKHLGQETRFASLQLGTGGAGNLISWTEYGTALQPISKPSQLFNQLFTAPGKSQIDALKKNLAEKKSLLDLVTNSRQSLQNRISHADREKLDQYLTSIRELEKQLAREQKWADIPYPKSDASAPGPAADTEKKEWLPTMYQLIALAFEADLTRVVTLSGDGPGEYYDFLDGIDEGWHAISHHNRDPKKLSQMTMINQHNHERFADFIELLDQKKEKDGSSLLDNSLALFGETMADGQHWGGNYPHILAGHAGGLKQGTHLKFGESPDYSPAKDSWPLARVPSASLYLAMLKAANVPVDDFANANKETLPGLA